MKELILGGARSGKSRWAEERAQATGLAVTYIATASALDGEMAQRIRQHRAQRPAHWRLVEEPRALASTLQQQAAPDRCLLVDCLTLWLSNVLSAHAPDTDGAGRDTLTTGLFAQERAALCAALPGLPGHIILVSNEVGLGVVPLGALTRRYCDEAGRLHQELAVLCDRVTFMVAGLPHILKGNDPCPSRG
jgi:adenosylcobinamide kinase/adenosylcobinamide-phosphate guanylyltransferase